MDYSISFPTGTTKYVFQNSFESLFSLYDPAHCVLITDTNVGKVYSTLLHGLKTIVIPAGEEHKNWETMETVTNQLLQFEAHKKSTIIALGGGVVTDIAGFAASIYMRGVPFGFVPTTLLGMVDAAVGGKNGINFGANKNLLGNIRQPDFILFGTNFLKTLPDEEWSNGFAEVIKYACLFDAAMFEELERNNIGHYRGNQSELRDLISRCVAWKNKIVLADEKESNSRKLLNFGHTLGHALENLYRLPHGHAVALGMVAACILSENVLNTSAALKEKLVHLLKLYKLPTSLEFDPKEAMKLLKMDKKRNEAAIDYILLKDIGEPLIMALPFHIIEQAVISFSHAGTY